GRWSPPRPPLGSKRQQSAPVAASHSRRQHRCGLSGRSRGRGHGSPLWCGRPRAQRKPGEQGCGKCHGDPCYAHAIDDAHDTETSCISSAGDADDKTEKTHEVEYASAAVEPNACTMALTKPSHTFTRPVRITANKSAKDMY